MSAPNTPNTDYQPLSFDQAIQFYWDAPNDNGSPILDYRLTLNYSGGSLVYTPAATDITFLATGLTNGVTYSATLEARNANGYSTPGTYRDWQSGAPPSIPVTATATLVGSNGAFISWTAGTPVNAQVQWYVIDVYSTSNPLPLISYSANGLTQSNFFISGLSTNLTYYFNVSAVNCPDYSTPKRTSTIQYLVPFAPTQFSGLVQWLDSQDTTTLFQNTAGTTPVTATGQNVAYWSDKSGCNNSVSSNASIAVPLYGSGLISTFNALNFASSRMLRTAGTFAKSSNVTFITVGVVKNTIGTWGTWWGHFPVGDHDVNAISMRRVNVSGSMNWHTNNDNSVMNLTYTVDSPVIYSGTMQNGSSMFFQQYNTASSANVTGTITQSINTAVAPIWVGASDSAGEYINGPIGEILYYQTVLTPYNRQKVEGYLAWKWGIQGILPTSHPFRTAAPLSNSVFSPTMFDNLQFWLDASQLTGFTNGQALTTWVDKSTNAYSGTATGGPTYQTNVINSLPIVRFNGSSQYVNFGNVLNMGVSSLNMFAVYKQNTSGSPTAVFGKTSYRGNAGRWVLTRDSSTLFLFEGSSGGATAGYSDSSTSFQINSGGWDRTTITIFQNGTSAGTAPLVNSANLSNSDPLVVGAYPNGSGGFPPQYYMNGDIAELLVYNRALSTPDRQTVEGYLAWKWGLQSNLPGTHPYYDNNPGALAPTIFTPSNFTGLNIWLDASDAATFTYSGANILTWADKSGLSNNLAYNTGSYATRTTDAGKTVVQFPTTSAQYNSLLTTAYTNNVIIFFVMKKTNTAYAQAMNVGGLTPIYEYDYGGGLGLLAGGPSPAPSNNNYYVVNGSRNTVNSGTYTTYYIVRGTGSGATTNVRVGPVFGSVCEVIVYNRSAALSETQAQQVEGYLAWKWGLQNLLPYTHPYKFINPAATTTNAIVSSGLLIEFDANVLDPTNWGGNSTRFWPNTGSLGQTQNATPTGSVSKNAAGNGVVLAGSSFYSFPNISAGDAWTVSMWIKRTGIPTGTPCYITQQWTSLPNPINFMISANNQGASSTQCIGSFFSNSAWRNGTVVDLPLNTWRQVVCTWNGSALATYVNGTLAGSVPIAGVSSQSSGLQYFIGRRWDNLEYIIAEIGQVLVYNSALTATQVAQNYSVTNSIFSV
jgi:hypothetical protein